MTLANLARMTTATTGAGTITLGSAATGFLTFAGAGITNGQTVSYAISDGANSETGRGVYTSSGTTLTRSVLKSTNSNAAISLSGSAEVFITALAEDIVAPALVFIAAYAPSAVATLDITGIDATYDEYQLHLQNFKPATNNQLLLARSSTNGGSSYDSGASDYTAQGSASSSFQITTSALPSAGAGLSGVLSVHRPSASAPCQFAFFGVNEDAGTGAGTLVARTSQRVATADVDAIRLLFGSGNIASGFAKLYGVQKS